MSDEIKNQLGKLTLLLNQLVSEGLEFLTTETISEFLDILMRAPKYIPKIITSIDKTLRIIALMKYFDAKYPHVHLNQPDELQTVPKRDRKIMFKLLPLAFSQPMEFIQLLIEAKMQDDMGLH